MPEKFTQKFYLKQQHNKNVNSMYANKDYNNITQMKYIVDE